MCDHTSRKWQREKDDSLILRCLSCGEVIEKDRNTAWKKQTVVLGGQQDPEELAAAYREIAFNGRLG
jgi:hypothetical protein